MQSVAVPGLVARILDGTGRVNVSRGAVITVYVMDEGSVVQQGTPLVTGAHEVPAFDRAALIAAIRADQEGRGTFPEFLQASWRAGVVAYDVDFGGRKVTYHGATRECYTEEYPAVAIAPAPRSVS